MFHYLTHNATIIIQLSAENPQPFIRQPYIFFNGQYSIDPADGEVKIVFMKTYGAPLSKEIN